MAVAATTTTTITLSTGSSLFSRLSGEFWQVGRLERKLSLIPRKHLNLVCVSGQYLLSSSKNMNLRPSFALRKDSDDSFLSNVEDTDEMFDDLFKKYGKVVYRNNDKKPPSAEVDDDAESLSFAVEMAKVASDVKAGDIMVLFVKPLVYWTRFFIIATAFSRPQIDAIATRIRDLAEQKYGKVPSGDTKPNSWTLLDFGDVVIHIFLPQQRAFYNLEEFYGNAMPIELPFENKQPPLRS